MLLDGGKRSGAWHLEDLEQELTAMEKKERTVGHNPCEHSPLYLHLKEMEKGKDSNANTLDAIYSASEKVKYMKTNCCFVFFRSRMFTLSRSYVVPYVTII